VPGRDGVPGSILGELLCGSWANEVPDAALSLTREWPLLLAAITALIGVRVGWVVWRRRVWRRHAAAARWLQIIPPVTATPAATVGLWRLLATVLRAPRRGALRPARLVWEVVADPGGMRCGLWLPPGVNPTAVTRVLHRAWPGVRAEQTTPPVVSAWGAVAARAVWPTQPDWLPLVEDPAPARRGGGVAAPEDDRLRAVYDGLAAAGRTGGALLQVQLSRAPAHRLRLLRRAMTNPYRAGRPRGAARAVGTLIEAVRAGILAALNLVTPEPAARHHPAGRADPYMAELARRARAKFADAPHLLVAVHAIATGPTAAAAEAAAADITAGFGLLSPHFTRRRLRRGAAAVADRWVPETGMSLASITEAAALAGLPAEPAAYGLPGAASRRRAPTRDVFRATAEATDRETDGRDAEAADPGVGGEPTAWSVP